jgi:hypothetical protein
MHPCHDDPDWKAKWETAPSSSIFSFQEVVTDLVGLHNSLADVASASYLMDNRFACFLSDEERTLKTAITKLVSEIEGKQKVKGTKAYQNLRRIMQNFGLAKAENTKAGHIKKSSRPPKIEHPAPVTQAGAGVYVEQAGGNEKPGGRSILPVMASNQDGDRLVRLVAKRITEDPILRRRAAVSNEGRYLLENVPPFYSEESAEESVQENLKVWGVIKHVLEQCGERQPELQCREMSDFCRDNPNNSACKEFKALFSRPGHVFVANASVANIFCDAFLTPGHIADSDRSIFRPTGASRYPSSELKPPKNVFAQVFESLVEIDADVADQLFPRPDSERWCADNFDDFWKKQGDRDWKDQESDLIDGRIWNNKCLVKRSDKICSLKHWNEALFTKLERSKLPGYFLFGKTERDKQKTDGENVDSLMETITEFTTIALEDLRKHGLEPRNRRDRFLFVVPTVGTGHSGSEGQTGDVLSALISKLCELSQAHPVDFCLTCSDDPTVALAQKIREEMWKESKSESDLPSISNPPDVSDPFPPTKQQDPFPCFDLLTDQQRNSAETLGEKASSGRITLFIGAGLSVGAGSFTWSKLLESIEKDLKGESIEQDLKGAVEPKKAYENKINEAAVKHQENNSYTLPNPHPNTIGEAVAADGENWDPKRMDMLLWADMLDELAEETGGEALTNRVAKKINRSVPSLLMCLLAQMHNVNLVTQNYDKLIESAAEKVSITGKTKQSLSVLPYKPGPNAKRWLLKMHGCVDHPEDIIITNKHYNEYERTKMKALGGIVQSSLLTSHFVFVGFSMSDPNYIRLVREVRRALSSFAIGDRVVVTMQNDCNNGRLCTVTNVTSEFPPVEVKVLASKTTKKYSAHELKMKSFRKGDRVRIGKAGKQWRKTAEVTNPCWSGRCKVKMLDGDHKEQEKSYLPCELEDLVDNTGGGQEAGVGSDRGTIRSGDAGGHEGSDDSASAGVGAGAGVGVGVNPRKRTQADGHHDQGERKRQG